MAAGDFYFAINATFRHILSEYGEEALIAYWRAMGDEYFAPLSMRFREGGLEAVESYWRDFFDHEPGGAVEVARTGDSVEIRVLDCPAIAWLRSHGREIVPQYCAHCQHVSGAVARNAGMTCEVEGGGGSCSQRFSRG